MKVCQVCKFVNTEDGLYCENCGSKLSPEDPAQSPLWEYIRNQDYLKEDIPREGQDEIEPDASEKQAENRAVLPYPQASEREEQPEAQGKQPGKTKKSGKKGIAAIVLVLAAAAAAAAAWIWLLMRWDAFFGNGADQRSAEETLSGEVQTEEAGEGMDEEKTPETELPQMDLDAVNHVYVQAEGIVAEENGGFALNLPQEMAVCAYNAKGEVVWKEGVSRLSLLQEDILDSYVGTAVSVRGKLSAGDNGDFCLQVIKLEADRREDETLESRYLLIVEDVDWQEAFADCISRGGHLAQINSEEEFQALTGQIEEEGMQEVHFYLGGRRDSGKWEYYWVDETNHLTDEKINPSGGLWPSEHWLEQEPSFVSDGEEERYINLIYYEDNWVLNDVPMDITAYYPGKTGYICEFDE